MTNPLLGDSYISQVKKTQGPKFIETKKDIQRNFHGKPFIYFHSWVDIFFGGQQNRTFPPFPFTALAWIRTFVVQMTFPQRKVNKN
ncbi:hypothetical protein DERF_014348 [Dermatophagoides farinae]|uniref:Uncharacterized protein n=1 Tax=Dermatophagoides farinae TaxID=6954 RepID=A0A922HHM2_DERFA|nr:hypothetical protein DERF_014348 [Dermatophagoides farinae]